MDETTKRDWTTTFWLNGGSLEVKGDILWKTEKEIYDICSKALDEDQITHLNGTPSHVFKGSNVSAVQYGVKGV